MTDARVLQQADAPAELTERDPVNRRAVTPGRVAQLWKRFFLCGDDRDLVPLGTRGVEHEKRKPAVARDEPELHSSAPSSSVRRGGLRGISPPSGTPRQATGDPTSRRRRRSTSPTST